MNKIIKLVLVLSFFVIANNSISQAENGFFDPKEATNSYENGFKQGKWIEYLGDDYGGRKVCQKDTATYYRLEVFNAGKLTGIVRVFYMTGQLEFEGRIISFLPEEIYQDTCKWFYPDGALWEKINYKNGEICGGTAYYNSGKLAQEFAPCVNGKSNGNRKSYYESGQLSSICPYSDGKVNGITKIYYENGMINVEINYKDDIRVGVGKEYFENGVLKSETPYTNGLINGIEKEYFENGSLKEETPYTNGLLNGINKEYFENGNLKEEKTYIDGDLTLWKEYDKNGQLIYDRSFNK